MSKKPYYITTAIAYTSRKPHIGNSYEIVLTDAICAYVRNKIDNTGEKYYLGMEEILTSHNVQD
jgi:methionyl-tRNA synthetase